MKNITDLHQYVPLASLSYCEHLFNTSDFNLHISRPRKGRLGDFTVKQGVRPRISVNSNLNPYSFLITYLHEVAHYEVYKKYGVFKRKKIRPHGIEWKTTFSELLHPVLNITVFPAEILTPLIRYSSNPKASTTSDINLYNAIKQFEPQQTLAGKAVLLQLQEGADFIFQNRHFVRGEVRRTRVMCLDKVTNKKYTIPSYALVEVF